MLANGNIFVFFPILVFPSMWTFETSSTPSFNSTLGPTNEKGPIFTSLPILALLSITL